MTEITHDLFGPARVPSGRLRLDPPLTLDPAAPLHDVVRPPRISRGVAYFMLRDGSVDARDVAGGASLWRTPMGGEVDRERTHDGIILISGESLLTQFGDDLVVADRASGRVRTRARLPGCTLAGAVASESLLYAQEVGEDLACACLCWDFVRSELRWKVPLAGHSTPLTLTGGTLLLAPDQEACLALSGSDGTTLWQRSLAEIVPLEDAQEEGRRAAVQGSMQVMGGRAFFGIAARHVAALDIETGEVLWTRRVGVEAPSRLRAYPDGDLYLVDATLLYRLDAASGQVKLEANVEDDLDRADIRMPTEPAVTDRFLYCGDVLSGVLGAVDTSDGKLAWTFACGAPIPVSFAPVIAEGRMYVVDREGTLYAFRRA